MRGAPVASIGAESGAFVVGVLVLTAALASVGCKPAAKPPPPPPPIETPKPPATIAFIEDDFSAALAKARSTKRLLVVDAWAPWCHTCLSMRAYVFHDPALAAAVGDAYVWASIDTEKPNNAAFVAAHPLDAWPTIFVIRPEPEETIVKWPGSATTSELVVLLDDARTMPAKGGGKGATDAAAAFVLGERAAAAEKHDEAIAQLRASLAAAPPDWPRRPSVVETLIDELRVAKKWPECVELAVTELPDLPAGTPRAMVAVEALGCGAELPKKAKERVDVPVIAGIVARMAAAKSIDLLADDRSSLYEALVDWRKSVGDAAGVKSAATAWASFLEGEAAAAKSKEERAVFDAHRLLAYLALGDPARAIPMLEESEKDFPNDYNPPSRLARVYFEMGKLDEARAAIERAASKVYGPRALRVAAQQADILEKMGKKSEAKAAIEKALAATKDTALTGGYAKLADDLRARAAKM